MKYSQKRGHQNVFETGRRDLESDSRSQRQQKLQFPKISRNQKQNNTVNINQKQQRFIRTNMQFRSQMNECRDEYDLVQIQKPFLLQHQKDLNQKIIYPQDKIYHREYQSLNSNYQSQTRFNQSRNTNYVLNHSQGFSNKQNIDLLRHIRRIQQYKYKQTLRVMTSTEITEPVERMKESVKMILHDLEFKKKQSINKDMNKLDSKNKGVELDIHYLPLQLDYFYIDESINNMTYLSEMAKYVQKYFYDHSKLEEFKTVFKDKISVIDLDKQVIQNISVQNQLVKEDVYIVNIMNQFYGQDEKDGEKQQP